MLLETLKQLAPNVHFSVSREIDENFQWDGDGPDPIDDGFDPCDVTVTASAIVGGELLEGNNYLGGSYFKPDEETGDVHGYLPQMLEEAAVELNNLVRSQNPDLTGDIPRQLLQAINELKAEMRRRYDEQQGTC